MVVQVLIVLANWIACPPFLFSLLAFIAALVLCCFELFPEIQVVTYSAALTACERCGRWDVALNLLFQMQEKVRLAVLS